MSSLMLILYHYDARSGQIEWLCGDGESGLGFAKGIFGVILW
jgi:hypothetical protein